MRDTASRIALERSRGGGCERSRDAGGFTGRADEEDNNDKRGKRGREGEGKTANTRRDSFCRTVKAILPLMLLFAEDLEYSYARGLSLVHFRPKHFGHVPTYSYVKNFNGPS